MPNIEELAVVALLADLPEKGLFRGQVGTVVQTGLPDQVLVEFCDSDGVTYAIQMIESASLMRLHHQPLGQVA